MVGRSRAKLGGGGRVTVNQRLFAATLFHD